MKVSEVLDKIILKIPGGKLKLSDYTPYIENADESVEDLSGNNLPLLENANIIHPDAIVLESYFESVEPMWEIRVRLDRGEGISYTLENNFYNKSPKIFTWKEFIEYRELLYSVFGDIRKLLPITKGEITSYYLDISVSGFISEGKSKETELLLFKKIINENDYIISFFDKDTNQYLYNIISLKYFKLISKENIISNVPANYENIIENLTKYNIYTFDDNLVEEVIPEIDQEWFDRFPVTTR